MKRMSATIVFALTVAMAVLAVGTASAQPPVVVNTDRQKRDACRLNLQSLVGLPRTEVRQRCGMWSKAVTVTTSRGHLIRLFYGGPITGGPYFSVLSVNGVIESVKDGRH